MKPILFCSFLISFFSFSCKPKPLDNLKEVALEVEERKVKRMSRPQIAAETRRVADSVLTLILQEQQQFASADSACDLALVKPYRTFREKYYGRAELVTDKVALKKLQEELSDLRKYRNELDEPTGKFPSTFQTLTDSLLYVRPAKKEEIFCKADVAGQNGFWVFRLPKQRLIEIKTVKVKPKPAKGPNW